MSRPGEILKPRPAPGEPHSCLFEARSIGGKRYNLRGREVRRRKECRNCRKRFTTKEVIADEVLTEADQLEHKRLLLQVIDGFDKTIKKLRQEIEEL